MADLKISQLTGATTPLAGTEVLPVVQSSSTVKVSVANLTAGRAVSAASLALTSSPLPTGSGGTALTSFTNKGVVYASSTSALATGSALEFDGTNFGVGTGGNTMNHQSVVYKGGANAVYHQIGNGLTGLASTQGIRLGLTAAAASELYTINSFNLYVDGSSALSITSARNTTFTGGNLVQGTAAKGVNFTANTPAAGMTSQLLNWYEEGTWTPTVRGSGTAGTYEIGTNGCTYTRIGRQVTLNVFIQIQSPVTGGGTGDLQITGVPFAKAANSNPTAAVYLATGTFTGNPPIATWQSFSSTSTMLLTQIASGGFGSAIPISFASAGAYIAFTMTYFV